LKEVDSKVAAVDAKVATVSTVAAKAANDAVAGPLKKASDDISKITKELETVSASAAKAGKVGDYTKVKCATDGDLGSLGYDTKTGVLMVCHKAIVSKKTKYFMHTSATAYSSKTELKSFGVISKATGCKNPQYFAYSGDNPTGTEDKQYYKIKINGCSQRPGGMTYTDLVLEGDFIITFKQYDGGDGNGYNMWSFFPEEYTGYTHASLRAWGLQNFWGVYSNTGCKYDVSWDGSQRNEGRKRLSRFCNVERYISFVREAGELSMYESKGAPGTNHPAKVMTKRNTWETKNTKPLRLGMFMHDRTDWIEVYSPGTSVTIKGK